MTNIDPKDDLSKLPEKQEQKPEAPRDIETANPSLFTLNEIAPPGKDSLHQLAGAVTSQDDELLSFNARQRSDADANKFMGRGLMTGMIKRDIPLGLRGDLQRIQPASTERDDRSYREFRWSQAGANPGSFFPTPGRQWVRYLAGDPAKLGDKPPAELKDLKNLTDKFLTQTKPNRDSKLTEAEKRDLEQSRRQLAEAETAQDLLSNATHLARLYQHLRYIEEARKALILSLGIDPENPGVRQLFNELERMHPADVGIASQAIAQVSLTKSALRNRIASFTGGRVVVVGDLLIDELLEGRPERISREAPVLILEHVDTVLIPGGAANTANNIASLGGVCHAVGVCGDDHYADSLAELLEAYGISHNLISDPSRPTTVKTRILSKSHSLMQQMLRLDRISHEKISAQVEAALVQKLSHSVSGYKALLLSDYKAGVITDGVIEACRTLAARHNLMLVVDAQDRFERFKGVTLMTPNQPDTEKAVGYKLDTREALLKAGNEIMASTGAKALLITRGAQGMVLFERNQNIVEFPPFNRSDVFDVTGAGDTVVGTMALALVTGATFVEAMALGNLAAGIVVRRSGTVVTSQQEMLENLEKLKLPE